jgi:peptidoglycan/LPS O-acetylase OafA/YrhL
VGILSKISLLVAHLWSISIEEQFYLIWPPVIRFGGKPFALIISIGMFLLGLAWIHIFWARGWLLWYDTAVQFLFFSAGALIAICTRSLQLDQIRTPARILLGVLGLASLSAAALISQVGSDRIMGLTSAALYLGYLGGLLGCVAIFIAVLGFKSVPAPLSYLGKISYGLYVFHRLMLMTAKVLWSGTHLPNPLARALLIDGSAFVFSVVAAHFSYKYFESPFLKLKERFTVVKSRPA